MWHERFTLQRGVAKLGQQAVLRVELAVPWNQHRRQYWCFDPPVMIGVNADVLLLCSERKLTALHGFQLVMRL